MNNRVWIRTVAAVAMVALASSSSGVGAKEPPDAERGPSFEHQRGEFLPGAPEKVTLFPGHPELEGRLSEASVIGMAYAALEDALEKSGYIARFKVDDFRTYYRREFARILVVDLLTLDLPVRLEVNETEVLGSDGAPMGKTYEPRWVEWLEDEDPEAVKQFMETYRSLTVGESLRLPGSDTDHQEMIAATSYRVTVEFDGETRQYRAVAKWLRDGPGAVSFIIEDHVTDAVDSILVSDREIAPLGILQDRALRSDRGEDVDGRRPRP